jgi:hypothetical protein
VFIGEEKIRSLGSRLDAYVLRFTETAGQPTTDLSQRMGLAQLAKQHGNKRIPATETFST